MRGDAPSGLVPLEHKFEEMEKGPSQAIEWREAGASSALARVN